MPKRKTLGWAGFAAAGYWLFCDYQEQKTKGGGPWLRRAIFFGWANILLTLAHVWGKG